MDREKFVKKMNDSKVPSIVDKEYMDSTIKRSIYSAPDILGRHGLYNIIIGIEELSELQKELTKFIRNKEDKYSIIEELADVTIVNEYVKQVCGISEKDLAKAVNIKLDRLSKKLNNERTFR